MVLHPSEAVSVHLFIPFTNRRPTSPQPDAGYLQEAPPLPITYPNYRWTFHIIVRKVVYLDITSYSCTLSHLLATMVWPFQTSDSHFSWKYFSPSSKYFFPAHENISHFMKMFQTSATWQPLQWWKSITILPSFISITSAQVLFKP